QGFQIPEKTKAKILVSSEFKKAAIKAARVFRDAGVVASLDVTQSGEKKTVEYAKLAGMDYVVFVGSSLEKPATVYNVGENFSRKTMIEKFLQSVGGRS
ncbi:MAG: hypothetical protein OEX09_08070, partial [Candidatus Bathyarchaeota archaeon]|nr:hypothetical protein [Candidatus Bathyarchaeota archaeon]